MTAVFLQVRLDSSRLPRKALADLGGQTVFERCLEALSAVDADARFVLTEPASAPELSAAAQARDWRVFVGSKDDVLDRFVQASRASAAKTIVRATGDNPLVSARLANLVLQRHRRSGAHYSALEGGPVGSGVEVVEAAALEQAWSSAPDGYEREHVSPFLYRRPERFVIDRTPVPEACQAPDARITLDTSQDLEYLRRLWTAVYQGHPPEVEEYLSWLTRNPR